MASSTAVKQKGKGISRPTKSVDTWKRKGLSICSDGWSDVKRRPLINIMGASSGGPIFLKSINLSGIIKDGEYIAKLFIKAIEDVDAKKVVQVITDNAEKSTHFKNCEWILKLNGQVSSLKNFAVNHDMALAIFQKYSELSLLKVAETRFASHIIMTSRIHRVKSSLEKMVMDDEWTNYKGYKVIEAKAREIKSLVMDDEWWDTIEYLLRCTEPIVSMLRSADLDCPKLHLIYDMWDTMIEKVKVIVFEHEGKDLITGQSNFFATIQGILVARWNKSNTPLHCMAHSLVPKYYHESWLKGESNGLRRLAPNEDIKISQNRLKCFQRYFKDPNDLKKASLEYGAFCCGNGYFGEPHVIDAMG
uniref:DUF659 domain-containing protein n=1 Tax=Nicotiana tabacum TaxID=4097 RepID=A0A1S4C2V0_TOBAC